MMLVKFLVLIYATCIVSLQANTGPYDVLVYGATASGVMAAVAASEEGSRVLLVEPGRYVGGMVTGGLSHSDYGDRTVIGGLTLEFYRKVAEHYNTHVFYWRGPEPHVGEKIMLDWLHEHGVDLWFGKRVQEVIKNGNIIERVIFTDGTYAEASVYIDAGYEGDLMSRAGVTTDEG